MAKQPKKKNEPQNQGKTPPERAQGNASLSYPWWAKLAVCQIILFWGVFVILFTYGIQTCVCMVRQAQDPVYIATILHKMAKIEKLPTGFKPQLAASIFNCSLLTFYYEPDNSTFMIWMLAPDNRRENARQLTDNIAEKGIPTISDEFKIEKKGAITVAGETLEYVSGIASDKQGRSIAGLIGTAILKDKRTLIVYSWAQPDAQKPRVVLPGAANLAGSSPLSMNAASRFLAAIKSF